MSFINKRIQFMRPRKNGAKPASYPIEGCGTPMRITRMFPMQLKEVSMDKFTQGRKESEVCCIQEMMTLFDCFERSDYNTLACQAQAQLLEQCYASHIMRKSKSMGDKWPTTKRKK